MNVHQIKYFENVIKILRCVHTINCSVMSKFSPLLSFRLEKLQKRLEMYLEFHFIRRCNISYNKPQHTKLAHRKKRDINEQKLCENIILSQFVHQADFENCFSYFLVPACRIICVLLVSLLVALDTILYIITYDQRKLDFLSWFTAGMHLYVCIVTVLLIYSTFLYYIHMASGWEAVSRYIY